jgi:hypothetical protein
VRSRLGARARTHEEETTMKVMVIVKASKASEDGEMPSQQLLTDM